MRTASSVLPGTAARRRLGRKGAFWTSASVLSLVLWSSGAPSVLYPIYAQQWSLSPLVITAVFASYQLALIIVLPIFGNLSDQFGRRLVMMWGVSLLAASAIVFAAAPHVSFLFVGRLLQGAGSGLAMGAVTASLVENNTSGNPRFASSLATVATAAGLTLTLVISGIFAQYIALPLFWSYIVLLALAITALFFLARTPADRPPHTVGWRPQVMRFTPGLRLHFSIAALSASLAFCIVAIVLSLGAHMIGQFSDTSNTAMVGVLLGSSSAAIGLTALLVGKVPARVSVMLGVVLTVVSVVVMAAAAETGATALFFAWCVAGGIAYAFSFSGGLGIINQVAPPQHRGAALSLVYLVAYVLQAGIAVSMGALATADTLRTGVSVGAVSLTVISLAVLVLTPISKHREPGAARSQGTTQP